MTFSSIERDQNFGNAREARKLFEGMRKAQSQRLRSLGRMPDMDQLRTLTAEDFGEGMASLPLDAVEGQLEQLLSES